MPSLRKYLLFTLLPWLSVAFAANPVATADDDNDDADTRINPVMEVQTDEADALRAAIPSYINRRANHLTLNGADWSALRKLAAHSDTGRIDIVHIGDSHLQADVATGVARRLLQQRYGDAGRGLVTPLKMASTNEPRDYSLRPIDSQWCASKLMRRPWETVMGFTGVSATPVDTVGTLHVATLSRTGAPQSFDRVRLLHSAQPELLFPDSLRLRVTAIDTMSTLVTLPREVSTLDIPLALSPDEALYGLSLERSRRGGLLYHVIGNNGATYTSYNHIPSFASGVASLHPDLIIVSLGANEAFSRLTADEMYSSIAVMVERLREANPGAALLLTTPMECQKSTVTTVKSRRRRSRRRTVRKVRTYAPNPRVGAMREVILRYGAEHGIPTYDFYTVAGGAGASNLWAKDGMMAVDRIHNSVKGYTLQGRLMTEAIDKALTSGKSTAKR